MKSVAKAARKHMLGKLGTRIAEHQKDFGVNTRATRTRSTTEVHESAITDHMIQNNHLPDCNNTKVLSKETKNTILRIQRNHMDT